MAIIENTCNYENFQKLINIKNQFEFDKSKNLSIDRSLKLGELQAPYEIFIKAYQDYLYFMNNELIKNDLKSLENQLAKNRTLIRQSLDQKDIQKKELELFKKKYNRAKELMVEGMISKEVLGNSRGIYLLK